MQKFRKNADKIRKQAFSGEGHGFMIGADFETFLRTITSNFRGSVKLFLFLGSYFSLTYFFHSSYLSRFKLKYENLEFYSTKNLLPGSNTQKVSKSRLLQNSLWNERCRLALSSKSCLFGQYCRLTQNKVLPPKSIYYNLLNLRFIKQGFWILPFYPLYLSENLSSFQTEKHGDL